MADSTISATDISEFRGRWTLDSASSVFEFTSRGLWGLLPVTGIFRPVSGQVEIDNSGSVTGSIRLDAGSISTGISVRDKHLIAGDFLDVESYPDIVYTPTGVAFFSTGVTIVGELSVRGETESVDVSGAIRRNGSTIVVISSTSFALSTFGIKAPLGMVRSRIDVDVLAHFIHN